MDAHDTAVEGNIIAKLDLQITPELEREGVAREISRFLNQMRKDEDFAIEQKVKMIYTTESVEMEKLISDFSAFLSTEALLKEIQKGNDDGEMFSEFSSIFGDVKISLVL